MNIEWQDALMRLGAATAAGIAIGINRDLTNKPIGMRTLALVSLGAAAVTVAAIQFSFIDDHPDALSRVVQGVIQGIMAGISFIGAGVILRDPKAGDVSGLTTAATVWVTAALGIACGLGAWVIVGVTVTQLRCSALASVPSVPWPAKLATAHLRPDKRAAANHSLRPWSLVPNPASLSLRMRILERHLSVQPIRKPLLIHLRVTRLIRQRRPGQRH